MQTNNTRGIILIIIAMTFFAMQDALIKFIFEKAALYEIFFGRYLIAAILLYGYIKFKNQIVSLKTYYPVLTILRVILHFVAFSAFFISLTYMPLATANALFFSSPFFVSIFAKLFLKEFIGIRRWLAILVGFIGVYIVLNPTFSDFQYKNLLPVFCAFCYAASMTITKYTSDKDNINTQLFYFYVIAILLCVVLYFFMGNGQFNNSDFDPTTQFIFREWFSNFEYTWKFLLFFWLCCIYSISVHIFSLHCSISIIGFFI